MKRLRVAMVAPPWLSIPPSGYGGIENVIAALVPALMKLGVEVELFTTGDTTLHSNKKHYLYKTGQYDFIHHPYYDAFPVIAAHVLYAMDKIKKDGGFDIVHSHNTYVGPLAAAFAGDDFPPVVHTLHGPPFTPRDKPPADIADNIPMWKQLKDADNIYYVGISQGSIKGAPQSLKPRLLTPVYNGINLSEFPYSEEKDDYFMTLARFHPDKGQEHAIKACMRGGFHLKMAGVVADMTRPRQVMLELANPSSKYRGLKDFRYFSDKIFPYLDEENISYVGDLSVQPKLKMLSQARALLFPIQWEEPFGMAPVEALACGTPVVAMARGALPEIIQHGVNGFLANNDREFYQYMKRVGEINPADCRKSVEKKFSAESMAKGYLEHYRNIVAARRSA